MHAYIDTNHVKDFISALQGQVVFEGENFQKSSLLLGASTEK